MIVWLFLDREVVLADRVVCSVACRAVVEVVAEDVEVAAEVVEVVAEVGRSEVVAAWHRVVVNVQRLQFDFLQQTFVLQTVL